jgi:hypothetical protein
MYLFTRQARLTGLDAAPWAVAVGAAAAKATGSDVTVWTRTMSPGFGSVVWSSFWEDLSTRETAFDALAKDADYLSLVVDGLKFLTTGVDDTLYDIVYTGVNPGTDAKYVGVIQSVCANGSVVRGMATGVEIAQKAEAITGHSTAFTANATGQWGGVGWITGYAGIADFETAQKKLNADIGWLEYVDGATGCYSEDPSVSQSLLYSRLG